jgi:hypothetical protein
VWIKGFPSKFVECSCGFQAETPSDVVEHPTTRIPDYVAEPWLVIREIAKQGNMLDERLKAFSMYVESGTHSKPFCISAHGLFELIAIDTTGKLAQLALDWIREQKEG